MRVLRVFVLVALVLTITATPAAAADIRQGNDVIIGPTETVEDDLYAFAATIAINGTVHGDVVAAGNNVSVEQEMGDLNKNTLLYNTTVQILTSRLATLRAAITGR